jgi:hypothetical protein
MQLGDQHRRARPTAARGTGWLRPPGPLVAESWAIVVLPIMGIFGPTIGGPAAGLHLRLGTECSAYCSPGCRSAPEQSDPLHTCDAASLTGAPHRCLQH